MNDRDANDQAQKARKALNEALKAFRQWHSKQERRYTEGRRRMPGFGYFLLHKNRQILKAFKQYRRHREKAEEVTPTPDWPIVPKNRSEEFGWNLAARQADTRIERRMKRIKRGLEDCWNEDELGTLIWEKIYKNIIDKIPRRIDIGDSKIMNRVVEEVGPLFRFIDDWWQRAQHTCVVSAEHTGKVKAQRLASVVGLNVTFNGLPPIHDDTPGRYLGTGPETIPVGAQRLLAQRHRHSVVQGPAGARGVPTVRLGKVRPANGPFVIDLSKKKRQWWHATGCGSGFLRGLAGRPNEYESVTSAQADFDKVLKLVKNELNPKVLSVFPSHGGFYRDTGEPKRGIPKEDRPTFYNGPKEGTREQWLGVAPKTLAELPKVKLQVRLHTGWSERAKLNMSKWLWNVANIAKKAKAINDKSTRFEFDIWNEPNHPEFGRPFGSEATGFFKVWKNTVKQIRTVFKGIDAPIVGPSVNTGRATSWMKEFLRKAAEDEDHVWPDVISWHDLKAQPTIVQDVRYYLRLVKNLRQSMRHKVRKSTLKKMKQPRFDINEIIGSGWPHIVSPSTTILYLTQVERANNVAKRKLKTKNTCVRASRAQWAWCDRKKTPPRLLGNILTQDRKRRAPWFVYSCYASMTTEINGTNGRATGKIATIRDTDNPANFDGLLYFSKKRDEVCLLIGSTGEKGLTRTIRIKGLHKRLGGRVKVETYRMHQHGSQYGVEIKESEKLEKVQKNKSIDVRLRKIGLFDAYFVQITKV